MRSKNDADAHGSSPNPSFYWRGQVWPRGRALFRDSVGVGAVVVAVVATGATWSLPIRDVQTSTIAGFELAYAALSFGACISGAVLALTLDRESRIRWASPVYRGRPFSYNSELLFVFTWAAVAQLLVVVSALLSFALAGNLVVGPVHPLMSHDVLLFLAYVAIVYAVFELFTVVFTISQVGVVIDKEAGDTAIPK